MAKKVNKKYQAAVIGCGRIGAGNRSFGRAVRPSSHAEAYDLNSRTNLAALVEIDRDKLALAGKNYPRAKLYGDIGRMMKEVSPDLVSLATPTDCHFANIVEIVKYGRPVILCEKPLAYNLEQAAKIVKLCKNKRVPLFVNHTRHFDPLNIKWAEKIKAGVIGRVFGGSAYYQNGLMNNGTHMVDLLAMILGSPASVTAKHNQATSSFPGDLNADGLLYFKNGAVVSLHSLSRNYGVFDLELFGEAGTVIIRSLGSSRVEYRKKIKNKIFKGYFDLSAPKHEGKLYSALAGPVAYLTAYLDGKAKALSTGDDGLMALKILSALRKSAKQNGKEIILK